MDDLLKLRKRRDAGAQFEAAGFMFDAALDYATKNLGPGHVAKLRESPGFPKRIIPVFKYPASSLLSVFVLAGEQLAASGRPFHDVMLEMGDSQFGSFEQTQLGKTLLALNGGHVHRLLKAAVIAYNSSMTFGKRRYEEVGEREGAMVFNEELLGPSIQEGILKRGIAWGAKVKPTILIADESNSGASFTAKLKW